MDRSSAADRFTADRPPADRLAGDALPGEGARSNDEVARALADALREALARGEEAAVPGLGTFRAEHHASRIERQGDGTLAVHPPRKTLAFSPDPSPDAS